MTKYVNSAEALPLSLHLWDSVPTQTGIAETKVIDVFPTTSIEASDTLTFVIPPMAKLMLDKVQIVSQIRAIRADGDNPAANHPCATAPHLAAALFRNVEVTAGGVSLVQSFDNSYAMFKFWNDVIHNTNGTASALKSREGIVIDSVYTKADSENTTYFPEGTDQNPAAPATNQNGVKRAQYIAGGKKVCLVSDLNCSILAQDKLLVPELEIVVTLTKNYSEFILLEPDNHTEKIVFDKLALRCTYKRPQDFIINLLEERLAKENAIYHVNKNVMSFHTVPEGATDFTISSVFGSKLPYMFLVGIQDRTAFGRTRSKNPFTLYPMKRFQVFVDGQEHFPRPVEMVDNDVTHLWESFLNQTGYINNGDNLLSDYYGAYPALCVDLTQDKSQNQSSLNIQRSGTVRLGIELPEAAPNGRVVMILAWYDEVVEITKDRQVKVY